jgi:hypothetical protein
LSWRRHLLIVNVNEAGSSYRSSQYPQESAQI